MASGGDGNHSGSLPSVGTYIDEQPITTAIGNLNVHLYDINRVEALAGPQGTLFGASSQAGTIRIITNKPDPSGFDFGMDVEANYIDHGEIGGTVEGFVNLPAGDNAAMRIVAWYDRDGGYIDNIRGTRTFPTSGAVDDNEALVEDDFNDVETVGARFALGIDLDDNWTVSPTFMLQQQKSSGTFAFIPRLGDLNVQTYRDNYQNDQWLQAALTVEGQIGNFDLVYSGAYIAREIDGLTDYSDYSFFYDSLNGSGAYFVADCAAQDFSCPTINPSQYYASRDAFTKLSQEVRLSSPQTERLRAQVGAFYQRQTHDIQQIYKVDGLADFISVPGFADTIWLTKQFRVDRDYALFGEASFDILDNLTLTGGLRYFKYDNTLIGFFGFSENYSSRTGVAACFGAPTTLGAPCTNLGIPNADGSVSPRRSKDDGFIHRLNLTYNITDDHMVYATWSRGFRPGGTNRRGEIAYLADFLTNYEVGFKFTLADGMLRWNAAAFQLDWNNFQFSIVGQSGLTEIRNAASARIRGIESDIILQPTDGLTFTAGGTYLDTQLLDNYCGETDSSGTPITDCANPGAPAGTRLPASPKFKGNLTMRYETPVSDDWLGHLQLAGVYQSGINSDLRTVERRLLGDLGAYGTIDAALGAQNETSGWSVEAYVTNLLDERGQAAVYAQCPETICATDDPDILGNVYNVPNQPRTFGLRIGYQY